MKLTAKQIKCLDEFMADKVAIDVTLNVALTYHSNRLNEITKVEKEFWEELHEIHGLDRGKTYGIKKSGGAMQVFEKADT